MIEHGITPRALRAYDERLCAQISALVLRNRGAGPFGILNIVDERCGGVFENIDDIIPADELNQFLAGYKAAAGFAVEKLNNSDPIIPAGARVEPALSAGLTKSGASDAALEHAIGIC